MNETIDLTKVIASLSPSAQRYMQQFFSQPLMFEESRMMDIFLNLQAEMESEEFEERVRMSMKSHAVSDEDFWRETSEARPYEVENGTLVIPVRGTLRHKWDYSTENSTGYSYLSRAFNRGLRDPNVKSIITRIDSPGGEGAGNNEISEWIGNQRGEKPLIASVDTMATSAAYNIAAAHDEVVMDSSSDVGSIGVIATHVSFAEMLDNAGIKFTHVYAGKHKKDFTMTEPLSKQAEQRLQGRVDKMYGQFTELVASHRNLEVKEVVATQANVFDSDDALDKGLADRVLSFNETVTAYTAGQTTGDHNMSQTNNSTNQSGTNNQVDTAQVENQARSDERARFSAVTSSEHFRGREALANNLLTNSDMSAEQIISALQATPKPESNTGSNNQVDNSNSQNQNDGNQNSGNNQLNFGSQNVDNQNQLNGDNQNQGNGGNRNSNQGNGNNQNSNQGSNQSRSATNNHFNEFMNSDQVPDLGAFDPDSATQDDSVTARDMATSITSLYSKTGKPIDQKSLAN